MARRRSAEKRKPISDPKYDSLMVTQFINQVMRRGKKTLAQKIVYDALDHVRNKMEDSDPLEVFERALDNIRPQVEVKSRRVGGATYQVPIEVNQLRGRSLAMRWVLQFAKSRRGTPISVAISNELRDAYNETGTSIKRRDDTHKMAQANRAFAHFRW